MKRGTPRCLAGPDLEFARLVSRITHLNPFLPERVDCEREALGDEFASVDPVWSMRPDVAKDSPNILRLRERVEDLVRRTRLRLGKGEALGPEEETLYEDLVLFSLYYRHEPRFSQELKVARPEGPAPTFADFSRELSELLEIDGTRLPALSDPAHIYSCFFQIRRAFHHIFNHIIGGSRAAATLRAHVWHSIFTHDMRRYRQALYDRMSDVTTLITGPSGTGKELVARAIGLSRYIPFDPGKGKFRKDSAESFFVLNVSALSPTLVESELFGHRRGAFTGALEDRAGWLEACPDQGTVFLDEVGEIDPVIQVKLLRVLQARTFQRLGELGERRFKGKIIAATNRDLASEMEAGRFRKDFFYRLCSDLIGTPSLRDQIRESPEELARMVHFLARRVAGEAGADNLGREVLHWVENHLGLEYEWPGNVRELEQCVRNVMIRKEYVPLRATRVAAGGNPFLERLHRGEPTAEELLTWYCNHVYGLTGSFVETARRLGIDRRTVRARVTLPPGSAEAAVEEG